MFVQTFSFHKFLTFALFSLFISLPLSWRSLLKLQLDFLTSLASSLILSYFLSLSLPLCFKWLLLPCIESATFPFSPVLVSYFASLVISIFRSHCIIFVLCFPFLILYCDCFSQANVYSPSSASFFYILNFSSSSVLSHLQFFHPSFRSFLWHFCVTNFFFRIFLCNFFCLHTLKGKTNKLKPKTTEKIQLHILETDNATQVDK